MNLSIIIPCYNELDTLEQVIQSVIDATGPDREIIVVDDGSTDGTRELLQEKIEGKLATVIYQGKNQGKGAALRVGFAAATKEIVIVQDADFEYDPHDYPIMIEPIINGQADNRFMAHALWETGRIVFCISGTEWAMVCSRWFRICSQT